MHEFEQEVREREALVQSGGRRASRRRGCHLPHEGWSDEQLRALNGPVRTYRLHRPMDQAAFAALPEDLRRQYLGYLQEQYGANDEMVAGMLGAQTEAVRQARRAMGLSEVTPRQGQEERWLAFCRGEEAVS